LLVFSSGLRRLLANTIKPHGPNTRVTSSFFALSKRKEPIVYGLAYAYTNVVGSAGLKPVTLAIAVRLIPATGLVCVSSATMATMT